MTMGGPLGIMWNGAATLLHAFVLGDGVCLNVLTEVLETALDIHVQVYKRGWPQIH